MDDEARKESSSISAITLMLIMILSCMFPVSSLPSDASKDLWISRIPPPSPYPYRPEKVLTKGKFLVASQSIKDPRFSETVILLVDYGLHGAMGLIINRPTRVRLSTVLPEKEALKQRPDILYYGGPVNRNQIFLLIRSASQPKGSVHVFRDIYVSSSQRVLEWMIDNPEAGIRFHAYAGYAGWAPGQLEREVMRGGWYIMQGDANIIFDKKPSEIWPELINRRSGQWVMGVTK